MSLVQPESLQKNENMLGICAQNRLLMLLQNSFGRPRLHQKKMYKAL
jgi:hypothetical protein